jgi:hypothetical protein
MQTERVRYRPPTERRDPLVQRFFIALGADGRPARAGQIKTVTSAGDYVCAVWLGTRVAHAITVAPDTPTRDGWMLFQHEGDWRSAYARLSR